MNHTIYPQHKPQHTRHPGVAHEAEPQYFLIVGWRVNAGDWNESSRTGRRSANR